MMGINSKDLLLSPVTFVLSYTCTLYPYLFLIFKTISHRYLSCTTVHLSDKEWRGMGEREPSSPGPCTVLVCPPSFDSAMTTMPALLLWERGVEGRCRDSMNKLEV
jgi:hypothetical protein